MGVNRVVYGDNTLIDLTADTINADELAIGLTAHTADGEVVTGLAPKTWTGTRAMYELAKDSIAIGTIINITDDHISPGGGTSGEHYSTEEQVIGTWIDGKPLYRKVVIVQNVAANDYTVIKIEDDMVLKNFYGVAKLSNNTIYSIFAPEGLNIPYRYDPGNKGLVGRTKSSAGITKAEVIIEYTKTTD